MATFVDRFGGRRPGQLIRAEDWNDLVAALDALQAGLEGAITTLQTEVAGVRTAVEETETKVGTLTAEVDALQASVGDLDAIAKAHYRVNLSASRTSYAVGDEALVTAQLRSLTNQPLTFPGADRPFVDFVTVWGHFRPAPGFPAAEAAGARAISVRVDANGVARVLLRDDVGAELGDGAHESMSTALKTQVGGVAVGEAIMQASTPQEAQQTGVFGILGGAYDSKTSGLVQYVDHYYAGYGGKVAGGLIKWGGDWEDHRAVVLAFARTDADPLSPDPARGIASIQLTFRDWIGPFVFEYTAPVQIKKDIPEFRERLALRFTEDYFTSYRNVTTEIEDLVKDDRGLLGRVRDYQVVHEALDGVAPGKPQEIVDRVTTTVQRAVALQQTVEPAMATTKVASGKAALTALSDSVHEANVDVTAAVAEMALLGGQVEEVSTRVGKAEQTITSLDTRVQGTSSQLASIDAGVEVVTQKVNAVEDLYGADVRKEFLALKGTVLDVKAIKDHLDLPS
jgi:uncharacterized coiled-coil protein SlyX